MNMIKWLRRITFTRSIMLSLKYFKIKSNLLLDIVFRIMLLKVALVLSIVKALGKL